jgi:thioredoxin reductase (NADPH)
MTINTDVLIIGAGPAGLFQVFELGLLEIKTHVVDALPQIGGQCSELYPDKPIYDIPALPVCGAQELVDRLLEQIKPFGPTFHLDQEVQNLTRLEDGTFYLATSKGTEFNAKTVIIAAGVGAFRPRRLLLDNIDGLEGKTVHYSVNDPGLFSEKNIVVLGGGDSALDWALELFGVARRVTLIHRSVKFRAAPASVSRFMAMVESGVADFLQGNVVDLERNGSDLVSAGVLGPDSVKERVDLDHMLVFYGLSPKLGPVAEWGLDRVKNQIEVDTEKFQTNIPGVFAIGDIIVYPGKKKLILSGFHEAALVSFAVKRHLDPEAKIHLQYTTTSSRLHERLGIKKVL